MSLINKISSIIIFNPKKAIICGVLLCLSLAILIPRLSLNFGVEIWFKKNDPLLVSFEKLGDEFGSDNYVFLGLRKTSSIFDRQTLRDIRSITEKLWSVYLAERVDSLSNFVDIEKDLNIGPFLRDSIFEEKDPEVFRKLSEKALSHNQLPGLYLGRKGQSALFLVRLSKPQSANGDLNQNSGDTSNQRLQVTYRQSIEEIRKITEQYPYEFSMVGTASVVEELRRICIDDLVLIVPILFLVISVVVLILFKSWIYLPFIYTVLGATVASSLGIGGLLGLELNNLSSMVPGVLVAISLADCIHFLSTFVRKVNQQALAGTESKAIDRQSIGFELAKGTLQANFKGTLLTTITTFLGFLSLTTSDLVPIQDFGILCAAGSVFAWIFCLLFFIPMLAFASSGVLAKKVTCEEQRTEGASNFVVKVIDTSLSLVSRHPLKILFGFGFAAAFLLCFVPKTYVNSNPFNYFAKKLKIYQDNSFFNASFGGFSSFELLYNSGKAEGIYGPEFLKKVHKLEEWIKQETGAQYINSVIPYVKKLNTVDFGAISEDRSQIAEGLLFYSFSLPAGLDFKNFINIESSKLRSSVFWNTQDSETFLEKTNQILLKAQELKLDLNISGREYLYNQMNDYVVLSYFKSIGLSILFISVLLSLVFRSLSIGLLSLLPNLVPILLFSGVLAILQVPIDVGAVLVIAVCFGISVDDTIHILVHYNENRKIRGLSGLNLLRKVYHATGPALISTTFVLCLSFLVFLLADFRPNANYGLYSSIVFLLALVTDFLFLPAILLRFRDARSVPS